jgi:hypothetical protein
MGVVMKAVAGMLLFGVVAVQAQDFVAPAPPAEEIVPVEVTEPRPSIEGIVREIFTTRKPWQMVNPMAPKEYGSGERFVSKDRGPGTPFHSTGVVVMGVDW